MLAGSLNHCLYCIYDKMSQHKFQHVVYVSIDKTQCNFPLIYASPNHFLCNGLWWVWCYYVAIFRPNLSSPAGFNCILLCFSLAIATPSVVVRKHTYMLMCAKALRRWGTGNEVLRLFRSERWICIPASRSSQHTRGIRCVDTRKLF